MTQAQELLYGVRRMAIDLEDMKASREKMIESVAGAKSPKIRDPEMIVQFSRDTGDHMADIVAEFADMDRDITRMRDALEKDRERLRRMARKIDRRDLLTVLRLYYLAPFKIVKVTVSEKRGMKVRERTVTRREPRTWTDIAEIMNITRDPVMKRKRKLEKAIDEMIKQGM